MLKPVTCLGSIRCAGRENEMDASSKPKLTDEFMLYKGDEGMKEFFLFNISSGEIYQLNETSYDMLSAFDGKRCVTDVIGVMAARYKVAYEKVSGDAEQLVTDWLAKRILQ